MDSIDFLRRVYPEGPWALTAIAVDRKGIETTTFYPATVKLLKKWIDDRIGKFNLYWHVNPVIKPIKQKARREDIKEVAYLHVDIDPRVGEPLEKEHARIKSMLDKADPSPTFVIFSGGGYQAFWKLAQPIVINGDLGRAEDAKRYNMQLEVLYGGDNCHNIDRLCRLPGTMNIPDEKKRKRGRKATQAKLEFFYPERVYELSRFTPAPAVQLPGDRGFQPIIAAPAGNIKRLDSVEDLNEYGVPDRIKVIIVQGCVPDEPKSGDNSRSAWLFDCICGLVRCGVPDEVIYAIITDPDFLISASVIDKGSSMERYALRQIARAKEEVIDPWLRKLNEKHAVIGNMGGKCRVVEEINDPALNRSRLTKQSFEDFSNRYLNQYVSTGKDKAGKDILMPVGKWWLRHPQRRQYETIVFAPGRDAGDAYNLWKGFACEALPGDCSLFLEHLRVNICRENEEHYRYLLSWCARTVQHPDSPGQTAIVMRGQQGTGKSFFAKTFGSLFGRHFMQVADPKHLVGSFNSHLRDTVVLFGDEAFYAGDKRHESVLKMLITEEVIAVESKGIDVELAPNFTHVLLASNNTWVVPAGADERRFFVLDVGEGSKQDAAYFGRIQAQLNSGGREALLHYLMNYDLTGFEVRNVPKTTALHEQKLLSLTPEEEWWYRKLQAGFLLDHLDTWPREIMKHELMADYLGYMKTINVSRRSNETALGKFLHRVCPGINSFQRRTTFDVEVGVEGFTKRVTRRVQFYEMPTLDACRKRWCELYSTEVFADAPERQEVF